MTADWTACRVVRDRDGDMWFRGHEGADADMWTANTDYPDTFLSPDEVVTAFGPLVPVLDADGVPVVATVGDLTARHLGHEIDVEEMRSVRLLAMRQPLPDQPLVALLVRTPGGDITSTDYLPLDTPCELLP